jgi:hypothetical protein
MTTRARAEDGEALGRPFKGIGLDRVVLISSEYGQTLTHARKTRHGSIW